ncbi:MAG TPA: hypothetical protein VGM03_06190 [Phycisphaerae bacterium]
MRRSLMAIGLALVVCTVLGARYVLSDDPPEIVVRTISGTVSTSSGAPVAGVAMVPRTYGDLNDDGRVDLQDVALLQQGAFEPQLGPAGTWPVMLAQLRGPVFNIDNPSTWTP